MPLNFKYTRKYYANPVIFSLKLKFIYANENLASVIITSLLTENVAPGVGPIFCEICGVRRVNFYFFFKKQKIFSVFLSNYRSASGSLGGREMRGNTSCKKFTHVFRLSKCKFSLIAPLCTSSSVFLSSCRSTALIARFLPGVFKNHTGKS